MNARGMTPLAVLWLTGIGPVACLEYSPYDGTVCRTARFERTVFRNGDLVRERAFFPFSDRDDDLSQCSFVEEIVIEGTGTSADLQGLRQVEEVDRLAIGPTQALTDLSGLDALTSIDGDLTLVDNLDLASLDGLASLREVQGGVAIEDNPALDLCAVTTAVGQLTTSPDTLTISGVLPCDEPATGPVDLGTGRADELILLEGILSLLDVSVAGDDILVSSLSRNTIVINDTQRVPLAETSTPAVTARGVTFVTSPSGELRWNGNGVFFGGEWPLSFRDEVQVRFAFLEDTPENAVYAGWVTNQARIGDLTIEAGELGEGLWVGLIGPDGVPSPPLRVELPDIREVAEVVTMKAIGRDRIWIVVRSIFAEHRLVLVDLNAPTRSTSIVVGFGPIRFETIDERPDGVILGGRRVDDGNVAIGDDESVSLEGDFGFLLRIGGATPTGLQVLGYAGQTLLSLPNGAGGTRAPECVADSRDNGYLSVGADLSGDNATGRLERIDDIDFDALPTRSGLTSVADRPPLGLPFDRQLGCAVGDDGRFVVSGLDTFARGGPGGDIGWRLSTLDPANGRVQVREFTIGRIAGGVEQVGSTVTADGTALLYGPVPASIDQLAIDDVNGLGGRLEFFITTRQVFDPFL